jgi:hypothetical protein
LRLALCAGCKPFFEEDDACVEGVALGGCGVLPGVGAVFAGGVRIPSESVHRFRSIPYTGSGVFVRVAGRL